MTGANIVRRRTRLHAYSGLNDADRRQIDTLLDQRRQVVPARRDVLGEGEVPRFVHVVLEGWGCRYRQMSDGRRQILSVILPGDVFDVTGQVAIRMDHAIGAITQMTVAEVSAEALHDLQLHVPAVAQAVRWNGHVTTATHREWIVSLGLRSARERIAQLFCEVYFRLNLIGLCPTQACEFPLTQADVADATGLTPVHVNRMVQEMRRDRLIEWAGKSLTILDLDALCEVAQFTPAYLHLEHAVPA